MATGGEGAIQTLRFKEAEGRQRRDRERKKRKWKYDFDPAGHKLTSWDIFNVSGDAFTRHMLGSCEKALRKLAADEATEGMGRAFVVVAIEVHFQAIDLPLGNVLRLLTGPGSDATSQVMFPPCRLRLPRSASPCHPASCLQTPSASHHKHANGNPVLA